MVEQSSKGGGEPYQIHHLHQIFHTVRTQVTSIHHNVSSALAETFGSPWCPSETPIWLLGHRYEPVCEAATVATAASSNDSSADVASDDCMDSTGELAISNSSNSGNATSKGSRNASTTHKPSGEFSEAWRQIYRMTYRKGFVPMYRRVRQEGVPQYIRLTSDAGWGCMIRVGQMLVAAAIQRHRERYLADCSPNSSAEPSRSWDTIEKCFLDDTGAPFSIFRFIEVALGREITAPPGSEPRTQESNSSPTPTRQLTKKDAGDWFGPTTISETIAALIEQNSSSNGVLSDSMAVYLNVDGMLYEEEVRALGSGGDCFFSPLGSPRCSVEDSKPRASRADSADSFTVVGEASARVAAASSSQLPEPTPTSCCDSDPSQDPSKELKDRNRTAGRWRQAVLLLFPLQLGLEKNVNSLYMSCLLRYFELQSSLGAMGGRPRMAHFFVGRQGRQLLYVDPHVVQPAALPSAPGQMSSAPNASFVGEHSFRNLPSVQAIPVERIDSSISLAFYCCCDADLEELIAGLKRIEEVEENAPVRSEAFRPLVLRAQQVHASGHEFSFSESLDDYGPVDFMLTTSMENSSKATSFSRQHTGSFDLVDVAAPTAGLDEAPVPPVIVQTPARPAVLTEALRTEQGSSETNRSKPRMSVGSAWSCIEAPPALR